MADNPYQFCFYNYRRFYSPVKFDVDASKSEIAAYRQERDGVPTQALPLVLPVTPEEISIQMGNTAQTINTVGGRTFTHAIGIDLEKISFSGFFPNDDSPIIGSGILTPTFDPATMGGPGELASKFRLAMMANQPLIFGVLSVEPGKTNLIVKPLEYTITSFTRTIKHGHGADIFYDMELQRWYPQHLRVGTARAANSSPPSNDGTWPNHKKYRTVSGDNLAKIAYKQFRDNSRWKEIYLLNKKRLDPPKPGVSSPLYLPGTRDDGFKLSTLRPGVLLLIPKK